MAATIPSVVDPDADAEPVFLVTRREAAVLAVAFAFVLGAVVLLLIAGGHVASTLFGSG